MFYVTFLCVLFAVVHASPIPILHDEDPIVPIAPKVVQLTNEKYNHSCFWGGPKGLDYGLLNGAQPIQQPVLYPDEGSTYFVAQFYLTPGAYLKINGSFPNQRYLSFTVAHFLDDGGMGNGDNLRDVTIEPDNGSVNPFSPGQDRHAEARHYTIYVQQGTPPTPRPRNTLYTYTNSTSSRIHLSIRNYIPDIGFDGLGQPLREFGLPAVTLIQPGQATLTGSQMCAAVKASKEAEPGEFPVKMWEKLIHTSSDPINAPAKPTPVWELFWNTDYSVRGLFVDDPATRVRDHPANGQGGFANNPDTQYLFSSYSLRFGSVYVIRAKMPTHPTTKHHDRYWKSNTQLRYWSACTGGAPPSGAGWDCVFDEAVPVDEDGFYTLVVSTAKDRPSNAREECGVKWLDFGDGEGVGTGRGKYIGARPWVNYVYMRFQVTNPEWAQSPGHIPPPTISNPIPMDKEVMGEYFPVSHYETKEGFESQGCRTHTPTPMH